MGDGRVNSVSEGALYLLSSHDRTVLKTLSLNNVSIFYVLCSSLPHLLSPYTKESSLAEISFGVGINWISNF